MLFHEFIKEEELKKKKIRADAAAFTEETLSYQVSPIKS